MQIVGVAKAGVRDRPLSGVPSSDGALAAQTELSLSGVLAECQSRAPVPFSDSGTHRDFRCHVPTHTVVGDLNRFLGGWREYYRYGNSTRCFAKLDRYTVERMAFASLQTTWTERAGTRHEVHHHVRQPPQFDPVGRKRSIRAERKPSVKGVGEPGDRKGHARIDEEGLETCVARDEGWRLQATDGGGQAAPPNRQERRGAPTPYSTPARGLITLIDHTEIFPGKVSPARPAVRLRAGRARRGAFGGPTAAEA